MSLRDRVAAFLMDHPQQWIDGRAFEAIGGRYAWRTRLSNCRTQLGMVIENRQRYERGHAAGCPAIQAWDIEGACRCHGQRFTISEYRYLPPQASRPAALFQETQP